MDHPWQLFVGPYSLNKFRWITMIDIAKHFITLVTVYIQINKVV